MQTVTANGGHIPSLGFGTYGMTGPALSYIVTASLQAGFRHIDTAQIYSNEADVGEGVAAFGLSRSDVCITTKVWVSNYAPAQFALSVDESLRKLRTNYIDLLLLHWPSNTVPLADQIGALNDTVRAGKVRHIGVSNFNRTLMAEAVRLSDVSLVANQFEYHPYLDQRLLVSAAREAGLSVIAYCAMAIGRVSKIRLSMRSRRGMARLSQIVLRWLVQQDGVVALSRSTNPDRVAGNAAVFDFELSPEEMVAIGRLAKPDSRIVNPPSLAPDWD
ncbi:aldo/keto reductase [Mesorhizobium sp. AR10]|uniref:aldo/keto reductase n=1 Tax=Mesorhizobium sp. AR10 TaxID=2865839 RepID=UPI00215EE47D|nr:aldo/keto reductase [Mesorhizobium sp. AR10]UVK38786.1 aldo/keto reductase [Mesorhizobium sp. AR10]